jgi:hypothetical protein
MPLSDSPAAGDRATAAAGKRVSGGGEQGADGAEAFEIVDVVRERWNRVDGDGAMRAAEPVGSLLLADHLLHAFRVEAQNRRRQVVIAELFRRREAS